MIFVLIVTLLFSVTVSDAQEFPGGGRPSTDGFLVTTLSTDGGIFQAQGDALVSSPPPTLTISIRFGPTTDPSTFRGELDRVDITSLFSRTETGVTASVATTFGRHVLVVEITGVLPSGRSARDRDRLRFRVAPDTAAPAVTISSPQSGQSVQTSPIATEGTITENIAVVSSTISLNDQAPVPLSLFSNGRFAQDVQLVPGTNTIRVAATDESGNTSQATVTVSFTPPAQDTTPPDLLIRSPANNSTISGISLVLQGQVTDDSGAPIVEILVNGGPGPIPALSIDGSFTQEVSILDGPNTIQVRATDAAGNVKEESVTVTRDTASVTQFVTAAAGSTIAFPATGMTLTIPPGALSADALVTVRFPAQPTTPPTLESGATFASQRTEIVLEPVVSSQDGEQGDSLLAAATERGELVLSDAVILAQATPPPPPPTFVGPVTVTLAYDPIKVIEGTEFPFVWDGSQYRLPPEAISRTLDRTQGRLTAILDLTQVKVAMAQAIFAVIGVLPDDAINLGTTLTMEADQGPSIDRNALPVILVPGLFGDPSSLTSIRTQLTNTGLYRPLPLTSFPGLKNGILTNAVLLGSEFSRIRSTILNNFIPTSINLPVDVIGYSAGAIPARQFVSNLFGGNSPVVGSSVQIGPPNHGSIVVKNREAAEEVMKTQLPATLRRLSPRVRQALAEAVTWPFFTLEEAGRFPGASDLAPNTPVLNALNQSLPFSTLNRQFVIAGTQSLSVELDRIFRDAGQGVNDGVVSRNSASLDGQGGPAGSTTEIPFPFDHLRLPRAAQTSAEVPKHLSDWYVVTEVTPGTITPGQATTFTITIKHNFNRQARTLVAALFDANATQLATTSTAISNTGLGTTQMTLGITSTPESATAPRPISLVVASDADIASITGADLASGTLTSKEINLIKVGEVSRLAVYQRTMTEKRLFLVTTVAGFLWLLIPDLGPIEITMKFKNARVIRIKDVALQADGEPVGGSGLLTLTGTIPDFATFTVSLPEPIDPRAVNSFVAIDPELDNGFVCVSQIWGVDATQLGELLVESGGFLHGVPCPE